MAHIQKRNGRWHARWREASGRERATVFDRKLDAERWLDGVRGELVRGTYVDPGAGRELFCEVANRWLSVQVHRPTTAAQVHSNFENHILPAFGDRSIGSVRPTEVQAWVRSLATRLAPGTVEVVYPVFGGGLSLRGRGPGHHRHVAVSRGEVAQDRARPRRTAHHRTGRGRCRRRRRPLPGARDPRRRHGIAPGRGVWADVAARGPPPPPGAGRAATDHSAGQSTVLCPSEDAGERAPGTAPDDVRRRGGVAPRAVRPGSSGRSSAANAGSQYGATVSPSGCGARPSPGPDCDRGRRSTNCATSTRASSSGTANR
jgi:hypothetical protein